MAEKKYTSINDANAAGRVEFTGGKAVWQWAQDLNDSTSILVKCLDNPELELEKTQQAPIVQVRKARSDSPETPRSRVRTDSAGAPDFTLDDSEGSSVPGFDPYNRR